MGTCYSVTPYQHSAEEKRRRFPLWGFLLPFVILIVAAIVSESAKTALVKDLRTIPQPKAADAPLITPVSALPEEVLEPMMPAPSAVVFPDSQPRVIIVERKAVKAKKPAPKPVVAKDFVNEAPQINAENADSQIGYAPYYEPELGADYIVETEYQPPAAAPTPTKAPVQAPIQKAEFAAQAPEPVTVVRASALTRKPAAPVESPAAPEASSTNSVIPVPEPTKANFGFTSAAPESASATNNTGY